ncbi:MAG: hypothetical protein B6244_03095 [Candidatus Cloacimonetes bacterium 4572_55]|nr:MAG: hypothetical protein B6244_03095 [Candidatus Cloacimonetes bacterium 4572_55]
MRKNFHNRLTALGVILFLFVGIDVVIASPGINGGHSYWRVKTVSPIQARTFSVGNTTLYRQTDAGSDSELEVKNINLFFDLSYAFTDNFDLYAEAPYLSIDNGETESGLGDVIAGSRLAFPMSGAPFRVGLDVFAIMATGADMFTANSNDVGFRAIFDLNFNRFGFVINSGYLAVEKFDADSHRNRLLNGAALFFRPFLSLESGVELTAETVIQNEMDFMKSPVRVSPFLRWTHRSGFGMHLGGDIRISEDVSGEPDWGVGGGLSWTYRGTRSDPQHENQPKYEPQREETISDHPVAHTRIALTGGMSR